jgi:hypothetical protein
MVLFSVTTGGIPLPLYRHDAAGTRCDDARDR